jgi:hypothetical protein
MQNRYDARPRRGDGPPTWQPQPGEVLAGVIDRYTISQTPQGLVRTVIVTEARTGRVGPFAARLNGLAGARLRSISPTRGNGSTCATVGRSRTTLISDGGSS